MMGSVAYGVSSDTSDMDIYGFCIPPKEELFPHLKGEIEGFGRQKQRFNQWQQHHVEDPEARKEYDFQIYNIAKYFQLCMECNPNMIDSLYTPRFCVLHSTKTGEMVRENRNMFLSKKAWHTFKGYAYQQLKKMDRKPEGKRKQMVEQYGFDLKFAYHLIRLLDECEQILTDEDIDLQRNREQLKSIRRGEWTEQQVREWASEKEKHLEKLYSTSELRHEPDQFKIKQFLLDCLEEHYGNLSDVVVRPDRADQVLRDIKALVDNYFRGQ
jgi:predicted nucleotidyltransferase